jgi:uncharacterized protein Yka (UPF0111/DUF47 family)
MSPKKIQEVIAAANELKAVEAQAGEARKSMEAYLNASTFTAGTRTKILAAVEHEYAERIAEKLKVCEAL